MFRQILAKIQDLTGMKFVLKKKKKFLKPKQIYILYAKKSQKEKKKKRKKEKKEMNNVVYIPLIGCLF